MEPAQNNYKSNNNNIENGKPPRYRVTKPSLKIIDLNNRDQGSQIFTSPNSNIQSLQVPKTTSDKISLQETTFEKCIEIIEKSPGYEKFPIFYKMWHCS